MPPEIPTVHYTCSYLAIKYHLLLSTAKHAFFAQCCLQMQCLWNFPWCILANVRATNCFMGGAGGWCEFAGYCLFSIPSHFWRILTCRLFFKFEQQIYMKVKRQNFITWHCTVSEWESTSQSLFTLPWFLLSIFLAIWFHRVHEHHMDVIFWPEGKKTGKSTLPSIFSCRSSIWEVNLFVSLLSSCFLSFDTLVQSCLCSSTDHYQRVL